MKITYIFETIFELHQDISDEQVILVHFPKKVRKLGRKVGKCMRTVT